MFSLTVCSIFAISRVSGMKLGSHPKNQAAYNKPATGTDELTNARLEMIAETHGVEVSQPLLEWAENPCYAGLVQMVSILPKNLFLAGAEPCRKRVGPNKSLVLVQNKFNGCYIMNHVTIFSEDARASPFLEVSWKRSVKETNMIRFKIYFDNVQRHESRVGSFSVCDHIKGNRHKLYEQSLTYDEYQFIIENKALLFGRPISLPHAQRMAKKLSSMPALEEVSAQYLDKQFKKYKSDKRNHVFIHDKRIVVCLSKKCISGDGRSHLRIAPELEVPMQNGFEQLVCRQCSQPLPSSRNEDNKIICREAN